MKALKSVVAPNLPIPPANYGQQDFIQFNNVLRLYFNQLDNNLGALNSNIGGAYLQFPNGAWYDTTTQSLSAINTAKAVTYNSSTVENTVTKDVTDTSLITTTVSGYYNFQFSAQVAKTSGSTSFIWIWPRVNGVDIPDSNTKLAIQGANAEIVAAWNFVLPMNANDQFQLMWAANDINVNLMQEPAVAFGPAVPSMLLSATFVSALYDTI